MTSLEHSGRSRTPSQYRAAKAYRRRLDRLAIGGAIGLLFVLLATEVLFRVLEGWR